MIGPFLPSRVRAQAVGAKHYFTGVACVRGHKFHRFTSDRNCAECNNERLRRKHAGDPSKEAMRSRRRRAANPAVFKEAWRKYKEANPEKEYQRQAQYRKDNRAQINERARVRASLNREADRERSRLYQINNRERRNVYRTEWRKKNPNYASAQVSRRRALKKGSGGSHTASDVADIIRMQGNRCVYCSRSVSKVRHVDHIIPLSGGGSDNRSNIQVLCPPCNMEKSNSDPIDFARKKGITK